MKTAIQHLKISSARFHNFAFYLLTFYFLKLFNQFESIMQNKPNLLAPQMNISSVLTKYYENDNTFRLPENKPNTNPIRTQSNPISEKPKMNVTSILTKDYENDNTFRLPENKPNQTQFPKSQKWTKTYLPQRFMRI